MWWPAAVVLELTLIMVGCQPSPPYPPAPYPPNYRDIDDPTVTASQLTLSIRVALDSASEMERRVRLVAVVHDMDGEESTTDLGTYPGRIISRTPTGDELIRLAIENEDEESALRLIREGDFIEVRRTHGDGQGELIRRIPVPEATPVRVSDPPIQDEDDNHFSEPDPR